MSKRHPKTQFCIKGKPIQPAVRPITKNIWELVEGYLLTYYYQGHYCELGVPVGFRYDGASIPRAAWTVLGLSPGGVCLLFSLIHDLLYRSAGLTKPLMQDGIAPFVEGKHHFTRWESDVMMRDVMEWCGEFNKFQVRTSYRMVHRFGKKYFGHPPPSYGKK